MKKQDQRTRLTRMLIRQALTTLLHQKPIQSISIRELCELAGINRGTFYSHYEDIYDLLNQLEQEMLEDFQKALAPLLAEPGNDLTPLRITAGIFECTRENSDLCSVMLGPNGDKKFALQLLDLGRESCMACYGRYFPNATPQKLEYYYTFVSAGCIGLLEKWISDGMAISSTELAQMAEGIMLSGMQFLN